MELIDLYVDSLHQHELFSLSDDSLLQYELIGLSLTVYSSMNCLVYLLIANTSVN